MITNHNESTQCKHSGSFAVDEGLYCPNCDSICAVVCPSCGGQGWVEEDEYECDWVNCTNDAITCPECKGSGWVSDPSWQ